MDAVAMPVTLTSAQLDWYNRGVVLLMSVMRGRADHGQAELAVYDAWRLDGTVVEPPQEYEVEVNDGVME